MKKAICAVGVATACCLMSSSCMLLPRLGSSSEHGSYTSKASQTEPSSTLQQTEKGNLGDFEVSIKEAKLTKDYKDNPSVIVTYTFKNNSSESHTFMSSLMDYVYQNGVQLERTVSRNSEINSDNEIKNIKDGASIDVQKIYLLNDNEADLEVEVTELISFSDRKVVRSFKMNELPSSK